MKNKKLLGSILIILLLLVTILGSGLPVLAQEDDEPVPVPVITAIEPNNGPARGGTRVIIRDSTLEKIKKMFKFTFAAGEVI